MATFKFLLDHPRDKAGRLVNDDRPVYMWVNVKGVGRFSIHTGIRIKPDQWNFKQQRLRSTAKGCTEINALLNVWKSDAEIICLKHKPADGNTLKQKVAAVMHPQRVDYTPLMFSDLIDEFIEDSKNRLRETTLRNYRCIANLMRKKRNTRARYRDGLVDVQIEKINEVYFKNLIKRELADGIVNSTINNRIARLRMVIERVGSKYGVYVNKRSYEVLSVGKVKPFWLEIEEVQLLIDYDFTDYLKLARDKFLLQYYTGLRASDLESIRPQNMSTSSGVTYLNLTIHKTRRNLTIPLSYRAMEIIQTYGMRAPILTQCAYNRNIKKCFGKAGLKGSVERVSFHGQERIVEHVPKHMLVSSHTARRSFGRRWMERNKDIESLSQYLGHSSSAVTRDYIGYHMEDFASLVNNMAF